MERIARWPCDLAFALCGTEKYVIGRCLLQQSPSLFQFSTALARTDHREGCAPPHWPNLSVDTSWSIFWSHFHAFARNMLAEFGGLCRPCGTIGHGIRRGGSNIQRVPRLRGASPAAGAGRHRPLCRWMARPGCAEGPNFLAEVGAGFVGPDLSIHAWGQYRPEIDARSPNHCEMGGVGRDKLCHGFPEPRRPRTSNKYSCPEVHISQTPQTHCDPEGFEFAYFPDDAPCPRLVEKHASAKEIILSASHLRLGVSDDPPVAHICSRPRAGPPC